MPTLCDLRFNFSSRCLVCDSIAVLFPHITGHNPRLYVFRYPLPLRRESTHFRSLSTNITSTTFPSLQEISVLADYPLNPLIVHPKEPPPAFILTPLPPNHDNTTSWQDVGHVLPGPAQTFIGFLLGAVGGGIFFLITYIVIRQRVLCPCLGRMRRPPGPPMVTSEGDVLIMQHQGIRRDQVLVVEVVGYQETRENGLPWDE